MKNSMAEFTDAELAAEAGKSRHEGRKKRNTATAKIQAFDTIDAEPVEWLWPGRIAIGKESLYVGDPGLGKSQGTLDLAARLSTGIAFPDGTRVTEKGDTLILTTEDDAGDTIRPRLDALGADLARIHFLHCKVEADGKHDFPSLLDLDVFQDAADQIKAKGGRLRLLIVDPIEGFLSGADAYKNAEVRGVVAPLIALASRERFALVGVQHLNKGSGTASYRVAGSVAFTALARSAWVFCKDPEDQDRRLFLCLKNNLGVDQAGLEYHIAAATNGSPYISWQGPCDDDVRTVLSQDKPRKERDRIAPEQDKVLEIMKERAPKAVQRKELAEITGKSPTAINNILSKLRDQGLAEPSALYGYWQLSSEQSPSSPPKITTDSSDCNDTKKRQSPESLQSPVINDKGGGDCPALSPFEAALASIQDTKEASLDPLELQIY